MKEKCFEEEKRRLAIQTGMKDKASLILNGKIGELTSFLPSLDIILVTESINSKREDQKAIT